MAAILLTCTVGSHIHPWTELTNEKGPSFTARNIGQFEPKAIVMHLQQEVT